MKLLIVRIGALGDVLHALPAVAALHRAQPAWQIDWAIDTRWAALLVDVDSVNADPTPGPIVHRAYLAETRLWTRAPFSPATLRSIRTLRRSIRREHYDLVVDMQGTLRSAVIARFAAAPIAGYADPREPAAAWLYHRKLPRQGTHVIAQSTALLSAATAQPLTPCSPKLPITPSAADWAATQDPSGNLCILSPSAGWGAKRWPPASFAALARELRARGFDPIINAPHQDDPAANEVATLSQGAARIVVCNVTGLIALTRSAALLIGGDSGPVHLAATLGIPTVALFGPTDPARNGPQGPNPESPIRILRDPASLTSHKRIDTPDPGLARISVAQVLAAVAELLRFPET